MDEVCLDLIHFDISLLFSSGSLISSPFYSLNPNHLGLMHALKKWGVTLVSPKTSRNSSASFSARRMKLGKIIPRRPLGLSASLLSWRWRSLIERSSGLSSLPLTPGLLVSSLPQSDVSSCSSDFFSDLLLQSWSRRSRPSTPQPPPQPAR